MAETFRINVEAIMNPASLNAYEAAAEAAMKRLDAAAASGQIPAGQVQSQTRTLQVATQVGAQKLAEAGVTPGEAFNVTATMRAGFDSLRETYGIQLLEGNSLREAVIRGTNIAAQAQTAQQRADELRLIRAKEDASRATAAATEGPIGRTAPATATTTAAADAEARLAAARALATEEAVAEAEATRVVGAGYRSASASNVAGARTTKLSGGALYEPASAEDADAAAERAARRQAAIARAKMADLTARAERLNLGEIEGIGEEELQIKVLLAEQAARIKRMTATLRARESNEGGIRDAEVDYKARQIAYNKAKTEEAKLKAGAAGSAGEGGGGGFFSNLLSGGSGKLIGAAAAAAGVYTAGQAVTQLVKEAERAQVVLGQLQVQMEETGKANQFPQIRSDILEMSAATGIAVDKVASITSTMIGAFGTDIPKALVATKAGLDAMLVGGLNEEDVKNLFVAIPSSFGLGKDAIAGLNDEMLHLKDVFGTSVKETSSGVGTIAPLAAAVGLSLKETSTLVAAAAASSGRSATQVAGEIGRALTQIEKQALPLLKLVQQTPALQPRLPAIQEEIGQGRSGQVILEYARVWTQLTKAQQDNFLALIGGRREFASLAAAMGASDRIVKELDDTSTHEGRTARSLAEYHKSLAFAIERAKEEFRQLGEALTRAGVGTLLTDVAKAAGAVLFIVVEMVRVFASVNEATHGWAARLLELVIVIKTLQALGGLKGLASTAFWAIPGGGGGAAAEGAAGAAAGSRLAGLGGVGNAVAAAAPVVAVAATVQAGITYADQKGKVESAVAENKKALAAMDDATLARVKTNTGVWHSIGAAIFGTETQSEQKAGEQAKRAYAPLAPQVAALKKDKTFDKDALAAFGLGNIGIDKVISQAQGGNKDAVDALQTAIDKARVDPGKAAQLDGALAAAAKVAADATDKKKVESGDLAASADATKAAYEAGTASFAEFVASKDSEINTLKSVIGAGSRDKQFLDALTKAEGEKSKALSTHARELADEQIGLATLAGAPGPQTSVSTLTALLASGKLTDPKDQVKAAKDIVAAQQAVVTEQANMAQTAEEKLRILRAGVAIAPNVQVELLYNELNGLDVDWQNYFFSITGTMEGAAAFARRVAERGVRDAIGSVEALRRTLQDDLAALVGQQNFDREPGTFAANQKLIDAKQAQIDNIPSGLTDYQPTPHANATEDSIAQAQKSADAEAKAAADKAAAEAQKAAEEQRAQTKARLALRRAQAEGDPVAQAQVGIEEAQNLIEEATKESERIAAQAQLVTAQRQLLLAQQSVADAYRNIDKALASAAGDTVKVAELEIAQAREHLDNARGRGDQMAALQAEAELISAQAGSVSAQISTSERNTDFLLTMQKITTGQAIAQLEALLKIPGITQEQTQQLLLKIQQLRKSASADLAFNIPSDIKLPTIYEVRRANATAERGTSYNDSRQINISVTANNMTDLEAMAAAFGDAFSGPPRVGTTPRRY